VKKQGSIPRIEDGAEGLKSISVNYDLELMQQSFSLGVIACVCHKCTFVEPTTQTCKI